MIEKCMDVNCGSCHKIESPECPYQDILKDEALRHDVMDLLRQFMHVNEPLEKCSQVYKDALSTSASYIMQLVESHGYVKK